MKIFIFIIIIFRCDQLEILSRVFKIELTRRNVIKRFEFHVDIFSLGQTQVRANYIDMIARFFEENGKYCRAREREIEQSPVSDGPSRMKAKHSEA